MHRVDPLRLLRDGSALDSATLPVILPLRRNTFASLCEKHKFEVTNFPLFSSFFFVALFVRARRTCGALRTGYDPRSSTTAISPPFRRVASATAIIYVGNSATPASKRLRVKLFMPNPRIDLPRRFTTYADIVFGAINWHLRSSVCNFTYAVALVGQAKS